MGKNMIDKLQNSREDISVLFKAICSNSTSLAVHINVIRQLQIIY